MVQGFQSACSAIEYCRFCSGMAITIGAVTPLEGFEPAARRSLADNPRVLRAQRPANDTFQNRRVRLPLSYNTECPFQSRQV